MPDTLFGAPEEEPKDKHKEGFFVHDNLYCTIDTKPDGEWVSGWGKEGKLVFGPKHFPNMERALHFIEEKRNFFSEGDDNGTKSGTGKA